MSRWGKNIVVPLDSTKESANRPTVSRSLGTVGKWGKMGFTSTRTYTMSALPAAVAAAAAAVAAASPQESPASNKDDDLSISVPEPPKPRKFFKSRNTTPPEVIAQIIQQLPRPATSPAREASSYPTTPSILNTPIREPIKVKIPKTNSAERKKKSPKNPKLKHKEYCDEESENKEVKASESKTVKKKKPEKELKPEAPPSRILSRARKTVNYCEDNDEDRLPTPIKDILIPKQKKPDKVVNVQETPPPTPAHKLDDVYASCDTPEPVLPPPTIPQTSAPPSNGASKTPEHPPIVLRISKGTSRLVSTDSEEQPNASLTPPSQHSEIVSLETGIESATKSRQSSIDETIITPKIIIKPTKPPTPVPLQLNQIEDEPPEINYCTVKISPDKPPKERLKLIIKTDFIRNALAAAKAAAAAEKGEGGSSGNEGTHNSGRPEKERPKKNKKHKHSKHVLMGQPTTPQQNNTAVEFKTPSPHLALGGSSTHDSLHQVASSTVGSARTVTVISPPALSEKDFDSQSSVLGSISSKGNSTPQGLPPLPEESCVVHSRGSSVITSDLETSQHSSLVAPPSDIELRLESMMMDGDTSQQQKATSNYVEAEPLQEDIVAVLRGDENAVDNESQKILENGEPDIATKGCETENVEQSVDTNRRVTRGKTKPSYAEADIYDSTIQTTTRTRNRKSTTTQSMEETCTQRRTTRRNKRVEISSPSIPMDINDELPAKTNSHQILMNSNSVTEESPALSVRRGRSSRNANNNHFNSNNNNINKIAANLSAKAGAAELQKIQSNPEAVLPPNTQRSYGRKRKNQQVTQVLQPSAEELEDIQSYTPAKQPNLDLPGAESTESEKNLLQTINENSLRTALDLHETNSMDSGSLPRPSSSIEAPLSPPRRDYKIKDKFKRTLTLDNQVNNAVVTKQIPPSEGTNSQNELQVMITEPSVKLVISKKKGSIFKSRVPSVQTEQTNSKRHLYKHRWDGIGATINGDSPVPVKAPDNKTGNSTVDAIYNDFNSDETRSSPLLGPKVTRVIKQNPQATVTNTLSSVNDANDAGASVPSDRKDFYTVVRNVKTAHQIQEIGEYQEMDDDVEYILDALQPHNPMSTRCLSALQLATKCMVPAFRMHVRAHGIVSKFFKALADANRDLSLGLCTTAIMYILSQEGLNMDLDRDSLELMMNLLESEQSVPAQADHANYERNKQKVRELCEEIKAQGKGTHLNVESITVGTLAMETLLSLTSKRAGEWFKDELRELGGLEHIIKTINDCCKPVINNVHNATGINWTRPLLDNMQTVERCLRVLENVTQMNEENQHYILTYTQHHAVNTLCSLYSLCDRELILYPTSELTSRDSPGIVMRELLIPLMKVLINLTHAFSSSKAAGAEFIGRHDEVIATSFHLLLKAPNYIPDRCVFELSILALLLLINLTMYTAANRTRIMQAYAPADFGLDTDVLEKRETAISAIMSYFYKCEELARLVEKNTDAFLDNQDKNKKKQEEVDETVNNLLQKAGHHMEHSLKGSYTAILIGLLITDNEQYEEVVRKHSLGNSFKNIVNVLEKYYNFMNLTASSEASVVAHIKSTKKLLDYFKKRDLIHEMNATDVTVPLNLEKHHSVDAESKTVTNNTTITSTSTQRIYKTYGQSQKLS